MKYIYGPINSRRLGRSLGISLSPYKICDFDCVYCQLSKTNQLTRKRAEYVKPEDIVEELKAWLNLNRDEGKNLNYITISGLGEPTLNIKLGEVINLLKQLTPIPVALITNASLLSDPDLRAQVLKTDLILPSLDAVVPDVFAKIDRPHFDIKISEIIEGLINLRKEFRGKIWLEVMLVRGLNDDLRYIKKLKEVIEEINPDKIQLNSPVRSTSEPDILPLDKAKLNKIKEILGSKCEIL